MGHWIEREGRKWEDSGAFFAVNLVAAAGWYSVALVLVDKGEMEAMRQSLVMSRDQQIQGKSGDHENRSPNWLSNVWIGEAGTGLKRRDDTLHVRYGWYEKGRGDHGVVVIVVAPAAAAAVVIVAVVVAAAGAAGAGAGIHTANITVYQQRRSNNHAT